RRTGDPMGRRRGRSGGARRRRRAEAGPKRAGLGAPVGVALGQRVGRVRAAAPRRLAVAVGVPEQDRVDRIRPALRGRTTVGTAGDATLAARPAGPTNGRTELPVRLLRRTVAATVWLSHGGGEPP